MSSIFVPNAMTSMAESAYVKLGNGTMIFHESDTIHIITPKRHKLYEKFRYTLNVIA